MQAALTVVSVAFIAHSEWRLGLAARATSKEWASPRILCPGQARLQVMGRYGDELFCNLVKFMKYSIQNSNIFTILLEKIMLHFLSPKDLFKLARLTALQGLWGYYLCHYFVWRTHCTQPADKPWLLQCPTMSWIIEQGSSVSAFW